MAARLGSGVDTGSQPNNRVRGALRTVTHGLAYARHLVKGNYFSGEMSWIRPGSPPILLCHGFLGTRGTMLPLTKRFQADGRVVFSYQHGTFQLRSLRRSAHELVEHLQDLHQTLGIEHFDVVGFSMGGLVALHAVKLLQAHQWIRRMALLGVPTAGTWAGLAGVATCGAVSPSVWQILPPSRFLSDLRDAPMPPGIRVRQVHARSDGLCPLPPPIAGVDEARDYVVMPGGHSSLVVAKPFYAKLREFFDAPDDTAERPAIVPTQAEAAAE
jgi:pimeloyl-ACP methyl ester carboxylesterase